MVDTGGERWRGRIGRLSESVRNIAGVGTEVKNLGEVAFDVLVMGKS